MSTIVIHRASTVYPHPYIGPRIIAEHPHNGVPPCSSLEPPQYESGHWPCFGPEGWRQVEDHRGKVGWINGEEAVISQLGPLPEGWSNRPPLKSTGESTRDARREEILERLDAIDAESVRPLRALAYGEATAEDKEKLTALDVEAEMLRAELAAL